MIRKDYAVEVTTDLDPHIVEEVVPNSGSMLQFLFPYNN